MLLTLKICCLFIFSCNFLTLKWLRNRSSSWIPMLRVSLRRLLWGLMHLYLMDLSIMLVTFRLFNLCLAYLSAWGWDFRICLFLTCFLNTLILFFWLNMLSNMFHVFVCASCFHYFCSLFSCRHALQCC